MARNVIGTNDPFGQRIFAFLNGRQRRAIESQDPYAVGSVVGSVRSQNEDAGLVIRARSATSPDFDFDLAIVCDGMGGMQQGRLAAQTAVAVFASSMLRNSRGASLGQRMDRALGAAQQTVFAALRGDGGTTLSAVGIQGVGRAHMVHVGDSRIYAVGQSGSLLQLSRDDTLGVALNRNNADHADFSRLIQYIGMPIESDEALEPLSIALDASDDLRGYLLTSDGAHSAPKEILSRVSSHARTGPELVRRLLNVADALGGLDNATAIFVPPRQILEIDEPPVPGASLSLLSATGEAQIWIATASTSQDPRETSHGRSLPTPTPTPLKEVDVSAKAERERMAEETPATQSEETGPRNDSTKPARGTSTRRKTNRKKKTARPDEPALPLEDQTPIVRIHFPEDGGQ